MEAKPSNRIIDQRIRNRIMEAVHTLAEGDKGVRDVWPAEYFESFYDWIPHHCDGAMPTNSALTTEERHSLQEVSAILDQACDATPGNMDAEALIATGWPQKIQPIAQRAVELMLHRGRFNEDVEELEPSDVKPWP
jgi:hypothetical protein